MDKGKHPKNGVNMIPKRGLGEKKQIRSEKMLDIACTIGQIRFSTGYVISVWSPVRSSLRESGRVCL